ncbi:MAG: protein kinase [Acidobacteria bacterium]|nr:protein kinase [Acidobacteriota bacterium]
MALNTGTKLSHYEITSQIGKGGMGEVYQATDTKLGRDVAIKVLPEEFARDADRVARFQREAKLLASLNHPNIAAIHGLEESDGTHFLVMELIEGQTLDDRIKSGLIPVEEALKLALQIAEALEAAHEKGVIHRDLKPSNIKVTPEGKVKVLDFGLAKAFAGDPENINLSNSPTLSDIATQQGLILGTAAYMSPEQARGKPVDKRTDIWAFGCVLYEMLTGKPAFRGEDVTEILAAVVKSEVNLDLLPANIHPRVREVIIRCLQKDIKNRYRDVGDALFEIKQVLSDPSGVFVQPVTTTKPRKKLRLGIPWVAAALIVGGIIAGVAVWKLQPPSPPGNIVRFTHLLGEESFSRGGRPLVDISRDGTQLAYVADQQIWLRKLSESEARPVVGTDEDPSTPFFSPDGENIGFWSSDGELKRIPVAGGMPITITEAENPYGVRWHEDDFIVYGAAEGVWRVSANGGTPELIVESRDGEQVFGPQFLPGGTQILYSVSNGTAWDEAQIVVENLETGKRTTIWTGGNDARYLPTGHLIYAFENDLFALRFDPQTLSSEGGQASMVRGLRRGEPNTATAHYAISDGGTLVHAPGTGSGSGEQFVLAFVDRKGNSEVLPAPPRNYNYVRLSPDGERIAVEVVTDDGLADIWIYDIADSTLNQLTFEGGAGRPLWTPDGEEITYRSEGSLWNIKSDFSGEKTLLEGTDIATNVVPSSWSPDGQTLLFAAYDSGIHSWTRAADDPERASSVELIVPPTDDERVGNPKFSPDGKWFTFWAFDRSGLPQLYAYPFPIGGAGRHTITTDGGVVQVWPRDRKEIIFYNYNTDVMEASEIRTEPSLARGNPVNMIKRPIGSRINNVGEGIPLYDVSRDGERLLFSIFKEAADTTGGEVEDQRSINIILNWFEELKERVPVN